MAIYYFTIIMLAGLGFFLTEMQKKPRAAALYLGVAFVWLTFLSSLRYAIGFDYFSYRDIYEMTTSWSFGDIFCYCWYEPLFFIVCKCACLLNLPFQLFLTGVDIFFIFTAMWFIFRHSKMPWMSVYLYITLQFLAYNMNLIRQSIAVCFFLLACPYLKNRKLMPYTLLLFFGGFFHNSLWFVYPLYFILPKKHSKKLVISLLALTAFGYLFFDPLFLRIRPFLPEKYAIYPETYFWNSNTPEYLLLPAIYCLLIYLFRNRLEDDAARTIYLNSALYYLLVNVFITKHFILERFAAYPFVFSLIAIPDILASYRGAGQDAWKAKNYQRATLLFLLFGGAFFAFAAVKGFHHVYPYISLLDQSHSAPDGF